VGERGGRGKYTSYTYTTGWRDAVVVEAGPGARRTWRTWKTWFQIFRTYQHILLMYLNMKIYLERNKLKMFIKL